MHRSIFSLVVLLAATPVLRAGELVPMYVTGPNENRIDIVFLGDGYLASDLGTTYVQHVQSMLNHLFNEGEDPFPRYRNYFNVYRVNTPSNERGADVPPLGIFRDTALNARYYYDGVTERLLSIDVIRGAVELHGAIQGTSVTPDMVFATINDTRYGGAGGAFANYAGANSSATEIALHEVGHSFAHLADEYDYGGNSTYIGPEPTEPNVTKNSSGAKWADWLGYNQPGIGVIGAYEGAKYFQFGLYRPSVNSKMRSLFRPFDAVGREQFVERFYDFVDPLDGHLDNQTTLVDPPNLWVDAIDPAIIHVQWFVNGSLVAGADGETFDLLASGFGAGDYEVRARAFDPTGFDPVDGWVRGDASGLEEIVAWQVHVTVPEVGALTLLASAISCFWLGRRVCQR